MTYPQDVGLGKICSDIQTKFDQVILKYKCVCFTSILIIFLCFFTLETIANKSMSDC